VPNKEKKTGQKCLKSDKCKGKTLIEYSRGRIWRNGGSRRQEGNGEGEGQDSRHGD